MMKRIDQLKAEICDELQRAAAELKLQPACNMVRVEMIVSDENYIRILVKTQRGNIVLYKVTVTEMTALGGGNG